MKDSAKNNRNKTVEIPDILIQRLEGLGPHFCLVKARGKDPSVGGKGWQKQENLMSADDPRLQDHIGSGGNYGVVGGSGLIIVDIDADELLPVVKDKLPSTFTVQSPGSKGWHLYYLCSSEKPIRLRDRDGENVGDIQGNGKMVVGPGSIHPNGGVYQIVCDQALAQVSHKQLVEAFRRFAIPDDEIKRVEKAASLEKHKTKVDLDILQVVPLAGLHKQGSEYYGSHPVHGSNTGRNFWVNPSKNCWHCFRHSSGGGPLLWLAVEEGKISCSQASPGILRGEIFKQTLMKAKERGLITGDLKVSKNNVEVEGGKRRSQADRLIQLCLEQQIQLFHDQHGTPYLRIRSNEVNITLPIRSRPFKAWLANLLWRAEEKASGTEALYGAIKVLEAMALFDGIEFQLWNRVAQAEDCIWIDMTDERWRAIKVSAQGWQIVEDPPILFKRYSHQRPMIEPEPGGDPWKFLDFVNIDEKDGDTRLLLLCAIITGFIPLIAHVIIVLYGIQGSGKSMLFKLMRSLIDPSAVEVLTLPRNERERVQQLDHNWAAFYDNVTRLPIWMSDTLCRAATGGGFTKRELYTDDSDIIYSFKRFVGINGINIAAQRGDLLDRTLLVGLQNIPKNKRQTEKKLLAEFESCKPEILGGFLDTLVKAIQVYPSINPQQLFRMADFTKWGCAIAIALGRTQEDFINAYAAKVKAQIEEAAHASPLATVLIDWMESTVRRENWQGTPSHLYTTLTKHAKENVGISTRQKAWPKAPHVLVRKLNELAPSLRSLGWEVTTGIKSGSTRRIIVSSVPSVSSDTITEDRWDSRDAISPISSSLFEQVKRLERLVANTQGKCLLCEFQGRMDWQATKHNGDWALLCSDCGFKLQKRLAKGENEA